ncbi:MAG: 3-oxoacyl-[acyl-carrier-protein] synthase, KASII (EC [uncultured Aureispira sp.]|uniref:3-oxoacyl-[acyl-carrier-protein] synthase, KASII (EC) n=1 Tax=uncultured Aureispira sp. TaxID=1331704 RepID=A0A6S6THZ2_9BACT|nr:MAG: 3-oxoacyl-[acyl-carrier-protein] synthase, KASII (EC [uncultured Aureispira sp.]
MAKRIFITGIGVISAIGKNTSETLSSIKTASSGVGEIQYLQTVHKGKLPLCEVKYDNQQLCELANIDPKTRITRTSLLGIIAAQEAWRSAGSPVLGDGRTGVFSGNTVGGMDKTEHFYADFMQDAQSGDIKTMLTHECAESTERIADSLGATGMVSTISTACSSAANTIMLGARMIKHGLLDRAIVGGVDALTKFTVNGFNVLQILDDQYSQPFDENRRGLNLGEGAGFIVLEAEGIAKEEHILAELVGYANSNDAYHQTASSPDGTGAFLAMQGALKVAEIEPSQIDYVNVHGTGTANNDLSEGFAMQRLFGENMPKFSSTKAFTGHTLGASGGVEAVLSVLALQHKIIYPNLRFKTPIEALGGTMIPETALLENQDLTYVLSNSFGFGGNTSSLVFKAYK